MVKIQTFINSKLWDKPFRKKKNPLFPLEDKNSQDSLFKCISKIRSAFNSTEYCCQK